MMLSLPGELEDSFKTGGIYSYSLLQEQGIVDENAFNAKQIDDICTDMFLQPFFNTQCMLRDLYYTTIQFPPSTEAHP